jgi:hypothetical protein
VQIAAWYTPAHHIIAERPGMTDLMLGLWFSTLPPTRFRTRPTSRERITTRLIELFREPNGSGKTARSAEKRYEP